jgi:DNA-binding CsgD family transcriptional regulator/tetratricopeptide (TPR) repeat protein
VPEPWALAGREDELARVAAAQNDAAIGGVVIIGAAGVGKTRLAREALAQADTSGAVVRSVRATQASSGVPFAALGLLLPELDLPGEASAEVFRDVAVAFERIRDGRRLVLLVDDGHDLDDASAALLDHIVGLGNTFVVLTVRSDANAPQSIVNLWKEEHIVRIDLSPLSDAVMGDLATAALGPLEAAAQRALVKASGGNVLYLRELLLGGQEAGNLVQQFGIWRLNGPLASSARLQDLIGDRLKGTSPDERRTLELVALGDPLDLWLLGTLAPLASVEVLEERGLLDTIEGDVGPQVTLSHPLYGEVVKLALPAARRARLSKALADAAEAAGGHRPRDLLRIAVWRLEGGGGSDARSAIEAGRLAFRSGQYELAQRLSRAAWDRWRLPESAYLLGQSLDYLGRNEEAEAMLAIAWAEARDDATRRDIALRRATNLFRTLDRPEDADRVLSQATDAVSDDRCRHELEGLRGTHLLLAGEVTRAIELVLPLLADPDEPAFNQASLDAGTALALAGRSEEALRHTQMAMSTRLERDDEKQVSTVAVYVVGLTLAMVEAGRLAEAQGIADAAYQHTVEHGPIAGRAWVAGVLARICMLQGRLATAAHLFREVATLFSSLGHPGQRWGLGGLAVAVGQQRDADAGAAAIEELDRIPVASVRVMDVEILRGRGWVSLSRRDLAGAKKEFWAATELAHRWGQYASEAASLHDLVRIGVLDDAAGRLIALGDRVDGGLMAGRTAYARAVAAEDLDGAADASARFEAIGANLFAAEAAALEHRLAERSRLHRRSSAARERSAQLVARCEGPVTPALSTPAAQDRLSARELEIALLVAEGLSSREVAERLYVSVRTVDNHLQRVYTKLGITNRSELSSALEIRAVSGP